MKEIKEWLVVIVTVGEPEKTMSQKLGEKRVFRKEGMEFKSIGIEDLVPLKKKPASYQGATRKSLALELVSQSGGESVFLSSHSKILFPLGHLD